MNGTPPSPSGARRIYRALFLGILYVYFASILQFCFVTRGALEPSSFDDANPASFSAMIHWTAPWPFVYRTLFPTTVRLAGLITPDEIKIRVNNWATDKPFLRRLGWNTNYSYEVLLALVLIHGIWIIQAFLLRYLILLFYDLPDFVADLAPGMGIIFLSGFFISNWTTIYDPVTSFIVSIGIALIATRRYRLYYVFFPLAVLHKLTAGMFIAIFFLREFGEMDLKRLIVHVGIQFICWACIVTGLIWLFGANPGNKVDFQLFNNLFNYYFSVSYYHLLYSAMFFSTAIFLISYGWRRKPVLLRRMSLAAGVAFVPSVLLFGRAVDELRVWYEMFPFAFLLAVPTICELFGIAAAPAHATSSHADNLVAT